MSKALCDVCKNAKAMIKRPKTQQPICQECFFVCFEAEVHETIVKHELFKAGEKIAIGTSGGKDSTVLNHVLNKLNKKYNYGCEFYMLAIDEGIKGYRDDSLEAVKRNQKIEGMPLEILSYKELYGWTMDEIVKVIGQTNNCTYCGVFRRQALERGAVKLGCCKVVTGHNADDIAETVLMNMLRGDLNRLGICANAISGEEEDPLSLPRVKPLKYAYEKEIVMYAYHKKLDYFSTECIYSPFAYRGHVRELIKQM